MLNKETKAIDPLLTVILLGLCLLSAVVVSSVTIFIAERSYHNPFYFFNRHLVHLFLAGVSFALGYCVRPQWWVTHRVWLLLLALILLLAVFMPGVGLSMNGAKRWIRMPF